MKKKNVLSSFLRVHTNEVEPDSYNSSSYTYGKNEYLVLTDKEANKLCKEFIKESLWAFRSDCIAEYIKANIPTKYIQKMQADMCEGANEIIKGLIGANINSFINDAIYCDGRGHFISSYDGDEIEFNNYYIYRIN